MQLLLYLVRHVEIPPARFPFHVNKFPFATGYSHSFTPYTYPACSLQTGIQVPKMPDEIHSLYDTILILDFGSQVCALAPILESSSRTVLI
jgi:hypothetical protein